MFWLLAMTAAVMVGYTFFCIRRVWKDSGEPLATKVAFTVVMLGTVGIYGLAVWLCKSFL